MLYYDLKRVGLIKNLDICVISDTNNIEQKEYFYIYLRKINMILDIQKDRERYGGSHYYSSDEIIRFTIISGLITLEQKKLRDKEFGNKEMKVYDTGKYK